jgi:hypothetical protein
LLERQISTAQCYQGRFPGPLGILKHDVIEDASRLIGGVTFGLLSAGLLKRGRLKNSSTYSELDRINQLFPDTHFDGVNAVGQKILIATPLVRGSKPGTIYRKFQLMGRIVLCILLHEYQFYLFGYSSRSRYGPGQYAST